MGNEKKMMHVGIRPGEIGGYVLLPGSPERTALIAEYLDGAKEVAYNREYRTITGTLEGVAVSVTSTGMGGPSMGIAVEELHECGAHTLIRVGTCESASLQAKIGTVILPNGAVRMEGVAQHYLPLEYPAVPDMEVLETLEESALAQRVPYLVGIDVTKACFSTQYAAASRPMGYELTQRWRAYQAGGALCADMSCAPLFIIAGSLGIRAGAVLAVSSNDGQYSGDSRDWPAECEKLSAEVAVKALRSLIQKDGSVVREAIRN